MTDNPPAPQKRPELGVFATVVVDDETNEPHALSGAYGSKPRDYLRKIVVRDADELYDDPFEPTDEPLVMEFNVVSTYSLHVALYALQNPTPENIEKALKKLACSGDLEEAVDHDSLMPEPMPEPPSWERGY